MFRDAIDSEDVREKDGKLVENGRKRRENRVGAIADAAKAIYYLCTYWVFPGNFPFLFLLGRGEGRSRSIVIGAGMLLLPLQKRRRREKYASLARWDYSVVSVMVQIS